MSITRCWVNPVNMGCCISQQIIGLFTRITVYADPVIFTDLLHKVALGGCKAISDLGFWRFSGISNWDFTHLKLGF